MDELFVDWQSSWTPRLNERALPDTKFKSRKIVTFTGVRRCGKTYMMFQMINNLARTVPKERIFYINFEDERLDRKAATLTALVPSLMKLYGEGKYYLFLDELQSMPEWSRWLRRALDTYADIEFFVSGSTSALSSSEIPAELRGRAVNFEVMPLSFAEFLAFSGDRPGPISRITSREASKVGRLLKEYLSFGGFPEIVMETSETKKAMLAQEYFRTIISRDITERNGVKNQGTLSEFLRLLVNSTLFSASKTANVMKSQGRDVGKATLINYARYAQGAYFCSLVPILSGKIKDMEQYPKKVYVVDNAFLTFLSQRGSSDWGRRYENAVFLQLKRLQGSDPMMQVFYWRDKESEVDFVVRKSGRVHELIQVCHDPADHDTKVRECRALVKASTALGCRNLTVITEKRESSEIFEWRGTKRKICFIPLWKWLLA